jgi:hypothetical protein
MRMSPFALQIVGAAGSGRRQGQALAGALRAALTAVLAGTPEAMRRAKGDCEGWRSDKDARTTGPAFTQNS